MKIIRNIASVILSIFLVIVLISGIMIFTVQSFLSSENIKEIAKDVSFEEFVHIEVKTNPEIDEKFLQIPEVKEILERVMNDAIDYIFGKGSVPIFTDEEIRVITESSYFEQEGIKLTDSEREELYNELTEAYKIANEELAEELKTIKEEYHDEMMEDEIIRLILADYSMYIILGLIVLLVVLIGLLRFSFFRPLSWVGVSMIIAASLNLVLVLILPLLLTEERSEVILGAFIDNILRLFRITNIIVLILGIVLLVMYFIFNKKFGKSTEDKLLEEF